MATVVSAQKSSAARSAGHVNLEQWYGTSGAGAIMTIASGGGVAANSDGMRRLVSVSCVYSAAATVTVTVTHNYVKIGGTSYDALLQNIVLTANTTGVYQPTGDWFLADGDTITVVAPLLAAQTSAVVITLERL